MGIKFDKSVIGESFFEKYGVSKDYRIFRHVFFHKNKPKPEALFIVKFQLKNMNPKLNVLFSVFPMMVMLCMKGFREKYYLTDYNTGRCAGVYRWQTFENAERYSKSIAMRFMKSRSIEGSVSYKIIKGVK